MGLIYQLDCPECGYHFIALYGRGGSEEPQIKAKKRLETECGTEVASVYRAMKAHRILFIEADPRPYKCDKCRSFFNYDRVIIRGHEGRYVEEEGICPTCGSRISGVWSIIDRDKLVGNGQYGHGECKCECPKCGNPLTVTSAGIYD